MVVSAFEYVHQKRTPHSQTRFEWKLSSDHHENSLVVNSHHRALKNELIYLAKQSQAVHISVPVYLNGSSHPRRFLSGQSQLPEAMLVILIIIVTIIHNRSHQAELIIDQPIGQ